jgi:hypothetical protein
LRLWMPTETSVVRDGLLVQDGGKCSLALGVAGSHPNRAIAERGLLELGPFRLAPGQAVTVDTFLVAQVGSAGEAGKWWSPVSTGAAPPAPVEPSSQTPVWVERLDAQRVEMNWAAPARPCAEVFRHIMVSYRGPLRYRLHTPPSRKLNLVLGFCEGYHKERGRRVMEIQIEGRSRQTVDPVAAFGPNLPGLVSIDAQDENGDGCIDLTIAAAAGASDKNPLLNALWVFNTTPPPLEQILSGSADAAAVACVHGLAPETLPPGINLPAIPLEDAIGQTRARWAASSAVATDDATVREIFDKARFGLPGMVADNGTMNAGIFEYGAQWVRDTSNTLLGLIHAGQFELARQGFVHILKNMVSDDGQTMIGGGFDDPDREQFDQMGELLHALKAYRDWTGDDSLIREHRGKLVAMIERPLRPEFRDATGMVHNRREFWERTLDDAHELAYQTYLVLGLREAAALAGPLEAQDRAARWRAEADRTLAAALKHPRHALVEDGRLIKRRGVNGNWVKTIRFGAAAPDVPLRTEHTHLAEPDATLALPIAFRLVDPASGLARRTLDELERLWNARWFGGGYERYHSSGQCDQPGPWTFATCFILRAQHEAGLFDRSRRSLEWLNTVQGGRTGAWFEEIPLVRSQAPTAGILPWTSGEVSLFVVRHLLGVRFEGEILIIKPALYPNSPPLKADLRFRQGRLKLEIPSGGALRSAEVDGRRLRPDRGGALRLPPGFAGGTVVVRTVE